MEKTPVPALPIGQRRLSFEDLGSIFDSFDQVVLITDFKSDHPHPKILYVNSAFVRMTGYSYEEAIGKSPRLLQHEGTDRSELARIRRMLETPEEWKTQRFYVSNRRKNGEIFEVELTISPIWLCDAYDPLSPPDHWLAIQREIKATDKPPEISSIEAFHSVRMESLGNMVSGIAHDFNNLLTAIIGSADLGRGQSPEEAQEALELVQKAALQGSEMIRSLMAFARSEPAKSQTKIDVGAYVESLVPIFRSIVPKNYTLTIAREFDNQSVEASGDPALLSQVLLNFVTNAVESMTDPGRTDRRITIVTGMTVTKADERNIMVGTELPPGQYPYVSVIDTGVGMTSDEFIQLFTPYFSTKGRGRGTGLFHCMGLVRSMGGAIRVQTTQGMGSRFTVILPPAPLVVKLTPPQRAKDTNKVIASSDDDPTLRDLMDRQLRRAGYTPAIYERASGILDALREGAHFDAVLCDLNGSGSHDHVAIQRIRDEFPNIPVAILSGVGQIELEKAAREADCTFLTKPFQREALAQLLETLTAPFSDL